ncbi:hypothetical protein TYRP_014403 [Tyrophagus putrescentiae]|nr:hypothetical protein TYRP_014403 [Tyrophagus putrescentiae]
MLLQNAAKSTVWVTSGRAGSDVDVSFGQRLTLTTLGHCERPPTRAPLAPLARPESVDVHNAQVSSDLAALGFKQRLTLASLGSPKTPAYSDLARFAREALVGGRFW